MFPRKISKLRTTKNSSLKVFRNIQTFQSKSESYVKNSLHQRNHNNGILGKITKLSPKDFYTLTFNRYCWKFLAYLKIWSRNSSSSIFSFLPFSSTLKTNLKAIWISKNYHWFWFCSCLLISLFLSESSGILKNPGFSNNNKSNKP